MSRPEPASARDRWHGWMRVLEARDPRTSKMRLDQLSQDRVRPVRLFVARSPSAPASALSRLVEDDDPTVVWNALLNRHTPMSALGVVAAAATDDDVLRDVLAHHPNSPTELRGKCGCPKWCFGKVAFTKR